MGTVAADTGNGNGREMGTSLTIRFLDHRTA